MKDLSVEDWIDELEEGLKFRREFGLEEHWAEVEALFYHVHPSNAQEGPNLIASTGDALISQLAVPAPRIGIQAKRVELLEAARILESLDNTLITELGLPEEIEDIILHAYLWGTGILKLGYDSEWGWDPGLDIGSSKKPMGASLSQFSKKGTRIEYNSRVRPGMPWASAVLPHDIVVPYGTRKLSSAPWIAHRVIRHIDHLKSDPKYENKGRLEPTLSMEDFTKSYSQVSQKHHIHQYQTRMDRAFGGAEFCELWEIHDRRTERIQVVATGHDRFLRNQDDILQQDGLPFVSLSFVPRARSFWTTSDAVYLRAAQAEIVDISLQAQKQRRASVMKFLYGEDAIDSEELEKLLSGDVGVAAKVKGGRALSEAIMPMTPSNLNNQLQMDSEYVRRNSRELVGFSRNQLGEFEASGRRTAREAMIVENGSMRRMGRRELMLSRTYIDAFRKINPMIFDFWTTPRWTQILGQGGTMEWVQFNGPELKGSYNYEITFMSDDIRTPGQRRAQAAQLLQMLAQDPTVDQYQLRRYFLQAMNDPEMRQLISQPGNGQGDQNANLQLPVSDMSQGRGSGAQNG
jgi:hypothetical protein